MIVCVFLHFFFLTLKMYNRVHLYAVYKRMIDFIVITRRPAKYSFYKYTIDDVLIE